MTSIVLLSHIWKQNNFIILTKSWKEYRVKKETYYSLKGRR